MKNALTDASSAILLFKADLFDEFAVLYRVIMAEPVVREIAVAGYPGAEYFKTLWSTGKITVEHDGGILSDVFPKSMGKGENATILLHQRYPNSFIIMDDGKGAAWCRKHGIPYINALLVPRLLLFSGRMNEKEHEGKMTLIESLGRYSETIVRFARSCGRDELHFFLQTLPD